MKDSEVEFKECWEHSTNEHSTQELEKNMVQHRTNKRIMRYKLEAYQKNFPNFIYGNLINTKVSGQDEEIKVRPNGIVKEEEVQIEEPQDLKSGAIQKEVNLEKP